MFIRLTIESNFYDSNLPLPLSTMARPLQHHRIVSTCSFVLLFIAFILFLLVALSLPIIKTIYLLTLKAKVAPGQPATSIGTELRFGVWGMCVNRYAFKLSFLRQRLI